MTSARIVGPALAGALAHALDVGWLFIANGASFVAILWPLLRQRRPAMAAVVGAVTCLVLIPFTPVGVPILCATVGILVGIPAERPEVAA